MTLTMVKNRKQRGQRKRWQGILYGYGFVAPFLVIFALFSIYPDVNTLILSFENYSGFGSATPAGFSNYSSLFHYSQFWTELANTLEYWLLHALVLVPIALFLALIVRSKLVHAKGLWRAIIFLPQVVSVTAVTLSFQVMFASPTGVVNNIFGVHVDWLTDYNIAKWVVIALLVWEGLGFWFVVFLAGLTSLDPALEEAALIDGAGAFRRVVSVVIPLMKNMILFAVVIDAISSMALYTQPQILMASGATVIPTVAPLSSLVVSDLQSGSFGQSAAAGWLLFILTLLVSLAIFAIYRATGGAEGARLPRRRRWKALSRAEKSPGAGVLRVPSPVEPLVGVRAGGE